jgi:ArsR family transcriptional regulator
MLDAARQRVAGARNVELRQGDLESLPIAAGELDAAMLSLVLHYSPSPGRALSEVARVLRPAGRVLVVDMLPHERQEYQQQMATCGSGSRKNRSRGCSGPQGLAMCACGRSRRIPTRRAPRYSRP